MQCIFLSVLLLSILLVSLGFTILSINHITNNFITSTFKHTHAHTSTNDAKKSILISADLWQRCNQWNRGLRLIVLLLTKAKSDWWGWIRPTACPGDALAAGCQGLSLVVIDEDDNGEHRAKCPTDWRKSLSVSVLLLPANVCFSKS